MKKLHVLIALSSLLVASSAFAADSGSTYSSTKAQPASSPSSSSSMSSNTSTTGSTMASGDVDSQVLIQLHLANQMEIDAGNTAEKQAQSKDVKAFAKELVRDHKLADKGVTELAKNKKVKLMEPSEMASMGSMSSSGSMDSTNKTGSMNATGTMKSDTTGPTGSTGSTGATGSGTMNSTGATGSMASSGSSSTMDVPGMSDFHDAMASMDKIKAMTGAEFDRAFVSAMAADHQKVIDLIKGEQGQIKDAKVKTLASGALKVVEGHKKTADKLVTKTERQNTSGKSDSTNSYGK